MSATEKINQIKDFLLEHKKKNYYNCNSFSSYISFIFGCSKYSKT